MAVTSREKKADQPRSPQEAERTERRIASGIDLEIPQASAIQTLHPRRKRPPGKLTRTLVPRYLENICSLRDRNAWSLFRLKRLVDGHVPILLDGDHLLERLVSGGGDVDNVISRIEQELHRRCFIEQAAVDGNLGALGRRAHGHLAHPRLGAISAKDLLELADGLDAVGIAQRPQRRRKPERLARLARGGGGFIEVAGFAHQHCVRALLDRDLSRSHVPGILAVHENRRTWRLARDIHDRIQSRQVDRERRLAARGNIHCPRLLSVSRLADDDRMGSGGESGQVKRSHPGGFRAPIHLELRSLRSRIYYQLAADHRRSGCYRSAL